MSNNEGEAELLKILKDSRRKIVADIVNDQTGAAMNDENIDKLNRFHIAIAAVEAVIADDKKPYTTRYAPGNRVIGADD